ncbi:hypothetical protein Q3O59_02745 [Alkalimonas delamerensis]|uniref:Uncharacterized protein n=1 Tax=Alkalimonas delamerensis TaxID=265981 RepID=A0ABT9GLV5_9GAMM|nr:hypothetical protein [Alkalimonas delamerensis]MDP4527953.1 hypothetical protein [Alkalimonas delamerensis]
MGLHCSGPAEAIIHGVRLESNQLLLALPMQESLQLSCLLHQQRFALLEENSLLPQAHALLLTALMNKQDIQLEFHPELPECTITAVELKPRS